MARWGECAKCEGHFQPSEKKIVKNGKEYCESCYEEVESIDYQP